jgi:hypothetical protein
MPVVMVACCCSVPHRVASPRSQILRLPFESIRMLAGFRSRWAMFRRLLGGSGAEG